MYRLNSTKKTMTRVPSHYMWLKTAHNLYEVQLLRKNLETQERELIKKLKDLSHNQTTAHGDFVFVVTTRKGNVDYNAIPELAKVNLEKYRKADVATWRLIKG